jgi:hypothetical protein
MFYNPKFFDESSSRSQLKNLVKNENRKKSDRSKSKSSILIKASELHENNLDNRIEQDESSKSKKIAANESKRLSTLFRKGKLTNNIRFRLFSLI